LCTWHVLKDVLERLKSSNAEKIEGRSTHGWSTFSENLELNFIDVTWLGEYRQMRIDIAHRRIEEAESSQRALPGDERLDSKECTVLNKKSIPEIERLMREHLGWHPFKFPSRMSPMQPTSGELTSRHVWLRQSTEMHDLCRKFNEGYAWEYLWTNWYKWNKWRLWARAAALDYYPIIQTNAPVETHWGYVKNRILRWAPRPRIDRLCFDIMNTCLPLIAIRIHQIRNGIKDSSWHRNMVTDWNNLEKRIRKQDDEDREKGEKDRISLESNNHPATLRSKRMRNLHKTDIQLWSCQCLGYFYSAYHICTHLIRLYGAPCPLKRECVRQYRRPLLHIHGLHDPSLKAGPYQMTEQVERVRNVSQEEIEMSQEHLDILNDVEVGRRREDYSRTAEKGREWEKLMKEYENAFAYVRQEINQGGERLERLPTPSAKTFKTVMKLAKNANALDNGRRRRTTWGPERAGGNMYRN